MVTLYHGTTMTFEVPDLSKSRCRSWGKEWSCHERRGHS